jgi:hypothetical protein
MTKFFRDNPLSDKPFDQQDEQLGDIKSTLPENKEFNESIAAKANSKVAMAPNHHEGVRNEPSHSGHRHDVPHNGNR